MPEGSPNSQTRATEKYHRKAGYITKSFKLRRETADAFAVACAENGVSQASQITRMMKEYIESTVRKAGE